MTYDPNFPTGERGLIAVDKVGNQVLFLDPETLRTQDTLDGFASNVHELAVSPDHTAAFAPIYGDGHHGANPHPGNTIAVIDLLTRTERGSLSVAPYRAPHGLRWGPRGELYCVCEDSGVVLELDANTGEHRATIAVGSTNAHRMEILPDGSKLYTENEEDTWATVVDLHTGTRLPDIAAPGGLAGLGMHPDGRTIILVSAARPELMVVDTVDDHVVRKIQLGGHQKPAQIVRYSPNGGHLVVTSIDEDLATIIDAGLDHQVTVAVGHQPMDMAFTADGSRVIIANQGDGSLSEIDIMTAQVSRVVQAGHGIETLAYY